MTETAQVVLSEADCFVIEAAWQFGFEPLNDDDDDGRMTVSERDLVAFVRRVQDAGWRKTIEQCATAAEAQDRIGREWVQDSLWDTILRRAGANVRALLKQAAP